MSGTASDFAPILTSPEPLVASEEKGVLPVVNFQNSNYSCICMSMYLEPSLTCLLPKDLIKHFPSPSWKIAIYLGALSGCQSNDDFSPCWKVEKKRHYSIQLPHLRRSLVSIEIHFCLHAILAITEIPQPSLRSREWSDGIPTRGL